MLWTFLGLALEPSLGSALVTHLNNGWVQSLCLNPWRYICEIHNRCIPIHHRCIPIHLGFKPFWFADIYTFIDTFIPFGELQCYGLLCRLLHWRRQSHSSQRTPLNFYCWVHACEMDSRIAIPITANVKRAVVDLLFSRSRIVDKSCIPSNDGASCDGRESHIGFNSFKIIHDFRWIF